MQVVRHLQQQYKELRAALTEKDEQHFTSFIHVSSVMHRYWSKEFSASEMQVLMFVIGRTLTFKKRAETIAFRHFLEGLEQGGEEVCGPCGLKEKAIRAALKSLAGRGYLRIHAFFQGNVESLWRIYEVDVDRILEISPMKSSRNQRESGTNYPLLPKGTPPYSQRGPISSNKESSTSTSVEVSAGLLPTPKRPRARKVADDCNQFADPADLVKHIATKAQERRAERVSRASTTPTKRWTTNEVQALLDKARERAEDAGYTTPRVVVTARALPTLHKRMLAAQIADPLAFFTWSLQHWGTIASANRRSKARQARETRTSSEAMSMAPNFNDLAYRLPYIVAFYNDREQAVKEERRHAEEKHAKVEDTRKATETVLKARKELVHRLDVEREEERRKSEAALSRRLRTRTRRTVDDLDEEKPRYVEPVWGKK